MRKFCHRFVLFFLMGIVLFTAGFAQAQVTVARADLVVIGYSSDNGGSGDSWTLLALADIPGGSKIFITDRGWRTAANGFTTNVLETTITWTVPPVGVSAGSILSHDSLPGAPGLVSGGPLSLNNLGDQLLIYQTDDGNPNSSPTFIYGFNNQVELAAGDNTAGQWHSGTVSSTSGTSSNVPAGLTEVTSAGGLGSAFGLAGEVDNLHYSGSVTSGDKGTILAAIHDPANWTSSNGDPNNIGSNPFNLSDGAGGVFNGVVFTPTPTHEPEVELSKKQSLDGSTWTTGDLSVNPTDEIFYQLTVSSTLAIDLLVSDVLDANVTYLGTWNGATYVSGAEYTSHRLDYDIALTLGDLIKTIVFKVSLANLAADTMLYNSAWAEIAQAPVAESNAVRAKVVSGPAVVPEPATFVLLGVGLVGVLTLARSRRRRKH